MGGGRGGFGGVGWQVVELLHEGNIGDATYRINGARLRDAVSGQTFAVRAKQVDLPQGTFWHRRRWL